ncbi:diguanylate cyclase [Bowmanella sp. Y26]|uniref:diguanylate cyclase n=1 Tax=Bowmanella yangjiangensis TaxID=2811230 RepID=UPI001BDD3525|nr:diguanylate cyclase [Bowmanella yangjiangensis]MBT1066149.1 diguanylate cyclase [Bowmanella yangjiangensis]
MQRLDDSLHPFKTTTVLVVEDEPITRTIIANYLDGFCHVAVVANAEEALQYCSLTPPDLILSDVLMREMDGLELCRQLKTMPDVSHIPLIFITSLSEDVEEQACWEAGCVDYVVKPVNAITLTNRVKTHLTLKLQTDFLKQQSLLDGLTRVYNRHWLEDAVQRLIRQSSRECSSFCLAMFDVDWFKKYNDHFGHLQGDQCLREVAKALKKALLRPSDAVVRYGGEEFICLLPDTDIEGAECVVNRIKDAVCKLELAHPESPFGIVTLSGGLSQLDNSDLENWEAWLKRTDELLYKAKATGRNRVCIASVRN